MISFTVNSVVVLFAFVVLWTCLGSLMLTMIMLHERCGAFCVVIAIIAWLAGIVTTGYWLGLAGT